MNIHEYQAKDILAEYEVPVPKSRLIDNPDQVAGAFDKLGGERVVIKAQIHAGGRGKGGGVKVVENLKEARIFVEGLIGKQLVTPQTGPEGKKVRKLLVEKAVDIAQELYLSITLDRQAGCPVLIASLAGGMSIEEVAAETPDAIFKEHIDPLLGIRPYQIRRICFKLGFNSAQIKKAAKMFDALFKIYIEKDCSLVEINPLVVTGAGDLVALDAKINFDDSGLFRHADIRELRDLEEEEPLEVEASKYDLNYIKLDGNVGCMVNGAGLAMATMDIIKLSGGEPANFLDVGGGASADQIESAFRILLSDKNVKAVLINIFGGILRCDVLAEGVVRAARKINVEIPMVVRMEGTNVEKGKNILTGSGLNFTVAEGLKSAAETVVSLLPAN